MGAVFEQNKLYNITVSQKKENQQATEHHKNGLAQNSNKNISAKATSFTNSPPTKCLIVCNGARIGKLGKEVLPP